MNEKYKNSGSLENPTTTIFNEWFCKVSSVFNEFNQSFIQQQLQHRPPISS